MACWRAINDFSAWGTEAGMTSLTFFFPSVLATGSDESVKSTVYLKMQILAVVMEISSLDCQSTELFGGVI